MPPPRYQEGRHGWTRAFEGEQEYVVSKEGLVNEPQSQQRHKYKNAIEFNDNLRPVCEVEHTGLGTSDLDPVNICF